MPRSNFTGLSQFTRSVASVKDRLTARALNAVRDELEGAYDDSQVRVPVITGALKESGHINGPHANNRQITGEIVYDKEYASLVHENPNSRGYKYLEDPMDERQEGMTTRITSKIFR